MDDPYDALNQLANEIFTNSVEKGFYDPSKTFGEAIALVHSELSESLEAWREPSTGRWPLYKDEAGKPEGYGVELADAIIRILDMCYYYGVDIGGLVHHKMEYNKTRPWRHGKKI